MTLPLDGLRVIDLTQALSGPFATMCLGDMGAEVIKIESPKGDLTRTTPPHYLEGESVYFLSINRNKRSIVLDLKQPAALEVFYDLVRTADIVIHNFSPGVAERLKISHEHIEPLNPGVISCSISGFGTRGPDAGRRAVDVIVQAVAGGMSITGTPGSPPARAGIPTADLSSGLFAVIGILAALHERSRTGQGLKVETSLFQSQLSLLTYVAASALHSGEVPPQMGSGHIGTVPSQAFATSDGYIVVDSGFDHLFSAMCYAMGMQELAEDERFATRQRRLENREVLIPILETGFAVRSTAEWVRVLDGAGVPCGPVNNVVDALTNPHSQALEAIRPMPFRDATLDVLSSPVQFGGSADHPVNAAPQLGEHTVQVLAELGYARDRVDELLAREAVLAPTHTGAAANKAAGAARPVAARQ